MKILREFGPMVALFAVGFCVAAAAKPQSKMTLTSPNGKYSITLDATDEGAGIYVWQGGKRGASLYTNHQGPALTMYADGTSLPGVAVGAEHLQFVEPKAYYFASVKDGKWKIETSERKVKP